VHPTQGPGSLVPPSVQPWSDPPDEHPVQLPRGVPEVDDDILSVENVLSLGLLDPGASSGLPGDKPRRQARRPSRGPKPSYAGAYTPPPPTPPHLTHPLVLAIFPR